MKLQTAEKMVSRAGLEPATTASKVQSQMQSQIDFAAPCFPPTEQPPQAKSDPFEAQISGAIPLAGRYPNRERLVAIYPIGLLDSIENDSLN